MGKRARGGDRGTLRPVAGVLAATTSTLLPRREAAHASATGWLLMAPATAFLLLLFVVPIGYVLVLSVTDPTLTLANYRRLLTVPLYLRVMLHTFRTAGVVTLACLVLGYPLAYVIARRQDALGTALLTVVAMSFWSGFIVRTYAWLVILGHRGPIVGLYEALGLGEPQLLFTSFSATVGLTHILLPYMVLALFGVMRKIDPSHLRAAESLGARPFRAWSEVFLPLSLPGVVNGSVLVFTICLGFFITPILLGTPKDMMISQLIDQQIEELLAWGFGSAIAVVLLLTTCTLLFVYNRFAGLDRLWG